MQTANAINKTKFARGVMESQLGVDKDAWILSLATKKFRSLRKARSILACRGKTASARREKW